MKKAIALAVLVFGMSLWAANDTALLPALKLSNLTATQAIATDANKKLVSVAVTPTELLYVAGATSNIQNQIDSLASGTATPVGSVIMFAGSSCPTGYLALDGSLVSRSTYSSLYAIEGDTYGNGNGTTTFTLPNAGGVFIRGSGSQTIAGTTYTGTRGASERDGYQDHTHTFPFGTSISGGGFTAIMNSSNTGTATSSGGSGRAGAETKPANITLLYCVKT